MPSVNRGYTYNIKLGYLIQKYFLDQETLCHSQAFLVSQDLNMESHTQIKSASLN